MHKGSRKPQAYPWICRGFSRILDAQEIGADRGKNSSIKVMYWARVILSPGSQIVVVFVISVNYNTRRTGIKIPEMKKMARPLTLNRACCSEAEIPLFGAQ